MTSSTKGSLCGLKECPLCHGEPFLYWDKQDGYSILCDCGISYETDDEFNKEKIINEWNTRKTKKRVKRMISKR